MSGATWGRELGDLSRSLGQQGAINPSQADMLERLVAEVSSLTGLRAARHEVIVRTAVELTADERSRLGELVARRFGPGRRVTYEVDAGLLGGVWLRVGDRIIDSSLRGRLQFLRKQLG